MPNRYTGGWRSQTLNPTWSVSLAGTVPDSQHRQPDANPGRTKLDWDVSAARIELTPQYLVDDQSYTVDAAPGGPIDMTPVDHEDGIGFGPGLDTEASMRHNQAAHAMDRGATTARRWTTPVGREPDATLDVSLYRQPDTPVGSPETLVYQQRANPVVSPDARRGLRQTRFFHRIFGGAGVGNTMFTSDHRPRTVPNAFTAPNVPAPAGGAVATTPYASQAPVRVVRVVRPQLRRTPGSWDEPMTADSQDDPNQEADQYGFNAWGL